MILENNLNKIHETALKILQDIGINLLHPEVLDIVKQKGVKVSGQRAFFQPEQAMHWVRKAPHTFTLYARNPKYNAVIGGDNVQCSPGYGYAQIIMADGRRRDAQLGDYIAFAKLSHQCEDFSLNGGILAQPCDVPANKSHLSMLYAAILHSDKCLIGIPGPGEKMQEIMDMLVAFQNNVNLIVHSAGILDTYAGMSYEKFIVDLEIIRSVRSFLHGIEITEDALSFEVIKEVGPGGEFLTALDTLDKVRTQTWNSELRITEQMIDRPLDDQLLEIIHTQLQHMLDSYQKPELDAGIQKQLEQYLVQAGVDRKIIDAIKNKERRDNNDLWQSRYGN
jgi:trimethylamine:corrinoid methyltransferase-like protein